MTGPDDDAELKARLARLKGALKTKQAENAPLARDGGNQ